jgi:hypothetical protein
MKNVVKIYCLFVAAMVFMSCTHSDGDVIVTGLRTPQSEYAAQLLTGKAKGYKIKLSQTSDTSLIPAEGFRIGKHGRTLSIAGNGAGVIYGANRLMDYMRQNGNADITADIADAPEMKLRGACIGLQKTEYLPGHSVYEYPYTLQNFPWFYDRGLWTKYLDMLAADNMNAVYLWNGHPFASLVKLKDYPFAQEVDDSTMRKNEEMYGFITTEAAKRGIWVIQMFYNIIVSKPFADHYGIRTQDRNRPITPLISDYTRKSIAAFIEKYPNVGLLVCLGEAMATVDDDVTWMTETIIPGIKDGLLASHRTDLPPIILRSHDTDGPRVLRASLPLYKNIYTMTKYTGESLTTYEPGGPWAETQRELSSVAPLHISNVHILANLEPWRWASPAFAERAVQAMHNVHGANGLHLYPQASYWDWPYTADKLSDGRRLLQTDRDWMWYAVWGRYAWDCHRGSDRTYWLYRLADCYGTDTLTAARILTALDESGEIAPKLIRRFGITEGNRQTLLLGMRVSQLVNPYKYTIYPGFYESCGPQGEKLIEYVEREWRHQPHVGELPLDIVEQCRVHGLRAAAAVDGIADKITRNRDEFMRLQNDMHCYRDFAESFRYKVLAAQQVLNYKWSRDATSHVSSGKCPSGDATGRVSTDYFERAVKLLEQSDSVYRHLVDITRGTYLYANSMQTAQRRIPVGGDGGRMKTWAELLPVYEEETANLRSHLEQMKSSRDATCHVSSEKDKADSGDASCHVSTDIKAAENADISLISQYPTVVLKKGARLFADRKEEVDSVAAELVGLRALVFNYEQLKKRGATIAFENKQPVTMLVGYFKDDQDKFAREPKLETDASANDYGQAEPLLNYAVRIGGMPLVDIHAYHFDAGRHEINLPQGIIMVAGFTFSDMKPRDAGLNGNSEVDWLFIN